MENMDKGIGWLTKLLELARKYRFVEWIEVFLVIFITGVMITVFTHPGDVMDFFKEAAEKEHIEKIEKRQNTIAEAQSICDKLLYQIDADRVLGLEMHNSLTGLGGLPFLKASCTVQSLNDGIFPVDDQYQNFNLSLCPFSSYLYDQTYFTGEVEKLDSIDRSLKYRLLSNGVGYICATIIPGKEKALGFLFITWCGEKRPENLEEIKIEAQRTALALGVLLELRES